MIQEIYNGSDESTLEETFTKGLGELKFYHPVGTFSITPASRILFQAIIDNQEILHGIGIDWGCGIGCQAILAAKIAAVQEVYGLDISKENINIARKNAEDNGVAAKTRFALADSYLPFQEDDKQMIQALKGKVDFILSNPPSSDWDDGFGFRRMVLAGAKEYLKENGVVLLNASFQYGLARVRALSESLSGFQYAGVLASTDGVPFDLSRADLLDCLKTYAKEEQNGGIDYTFIANEADERSYVNARTALRTFEKTGASPITKWQTHLFRYLG